MISKKLNIIIFLIIILSTILLIISTSLDIKFAKQTLNRQITFLDKSIKEEYKKRLVESVNNTILFINSYYKDKLTEQKKSFPEKNELTEENQKVFINTIRTHLYSSIFEKSRYSWINKVLDFNGGDNYAIRLIHPNLKNTEGKLLTTKVKDIKGNQPYLEELKGIKKDGSIFFTYYFKQLNKDEITEKLSYAKLYKTLNWIIATGIPINELNDIIKIEKSLLQEEYERHIQTAVTLRIIVLTLFIAILLLLRKRLSKTLDDNEILNKKLEKRLNKVETSFDKFFDLPINLLLISDLKGKILHINPGWKKILGYDKKDIIGKKFLELVHPNDVTLTIEEMKKLSQGESTFYFENRFKNKKGSYKNLAWSANSIPEQNLIYAVAQDITEVKEKSHIMYQQSKMASIGEMITNIAHQWRQPLSIISTGSSGVLVKKENNDLDDEFLINTMNQITKSTKELSITIDNFRNFFTPNKDKTYFTTGLIFNKLLNLIEQRFEDNNIKIIKDIEDIKIFNYENELLQVLINILNNAKEQLSSLKIHKKVIFINVHKNEDMIYIEILDNGKGIDKNILDRVFEPYFTTKDKTIGKGIGLYMSEEIVRKYLQGYLMVENATFSYEKEEHKGASFTIVLKV